MSSIVKLSKCFRFYHSTATWCPGNSNNAHCFQDIPRTVDNALKSGWRKVKGSTCRNGGKFYGHRMVKNDDYSVTPLYDEHGIIAGVQVNVSAMHYYVRQTVMSSELIAKSNHWIFTMICNAGVEVRAVCNIKPIQIQRRAGLFG